MKPITLFAHEIRRLADVGTVTVWRPIDRIGRHGKATQFGPSNTPGYDWHFRCNRGLWQDYRNADLIKVAPHPPGSERWVRETWATDIHNNGDSPKIIAELCREAGYEVGPNRPAGPIWYQADGAFRQWGDYDVQGKWRSPATTPRWASRLSVVSKAVQARQVQSVTEEEAVEAGLADLTAFSEWWQRRFDTLGPDPWAWATTLEVKQ